ncbi:MAG: PAS domain S-box protein [Nitrospirae bacterium]|nr:PAS domain S-box protein [Nitrospirota bacterium]
MGNEKITKDGKHTADAETAWPSGAESLYKNAFLHSNDGIFICDIEGNIADANQKASHLLGYTREELLARNISSLHPEDSIELAGSALKSIFSSGSANFVVSFRKKDGTAFPADVSSSLFRADGGIFIQSAVRDITPRRAAENKLMESELMFREFFKRSPTGIIIYPVTKEPLERKLDFAIMNSTFHNLFGYTKEEISKLSVSDISHPDDMEHNSALLNEMLSGMRDNYQMEKRYVRKGGETFWGLINVTTLRDAFGRNSHVMTTLIDITQRKKAKEALIAERNFSISIINSLPDIFYCFDDAGKFLLWNENFERISGYSADEISGRSVFDFFSGKDKKAVYDTVREVFERGKSTVEANLVLKNERKIPYFFIGQRTDIDGKTYLLGTGMDISERKKMEEDLRGLSLSDELTGLYNRRGFMTLAEQELRIARRMKRGVILFYADLDDLKVINDGFGHVEGDNMIKDTARFLQELFRESDIIARIGGDEFTVFSIQTTDTSVDTIRSRFDIQLDDFNRKREKPYRLSISIGIVHYREDCPDTIEELLTQADKLMYDHKKSKNKRTRK